jgi:general secretion pathway protein F
LGAFEYTAVDATGRERKGVLEGDTARAVRQMLRDQSLLPLAVSEVLLTENRRERKQFSLRRGISAADLSLLTRQIATLVRSGLPLEESLLAVSEQTERPRIRSIIMGVRAKVMEGHALADGLGDFPAVFPELYRATVSAGEQSGHLDTVLERLADYTESREQLRSRTLTAMLYPVLLFIVCVSIVAMLLTFVVPKIVKQFENSKAELPFLTQVLIAFSDFLRNWGLLLLAVLILGSIAFVRWLRDPAARRRFDTFLLRLPLIGKVVRGNNTARFARTFSTLTSSAVPVLEAMRISGEVVTNLPMRDAVQAAAARVREDDPPDLVGRKQRRHRDHAGPRGDQPGAGDGFHPRRRGRPARAVDDSGDGRARAADRARDVAADFPAQSTHCLTRARVAQKSLLRDGTRPLI